MLGTEAKLVVSNKSPQLMQISSFTSVRIIGYTLVSELFINDLFSFRGFHIFCWPGRYLIRLEIYEITVHVIASGAYCKMERLPLFTLDRFLRFFSSLCSFHHLTGRTRNHGHYVCSTWGNNHFKTFDGDVYQFPGVCEYNFVSDCRDAYKEFSVHIQRALNSDGHPEIQYILMKIKDITIYLKSNLVVVDGHM